MADLALLERRLLPAPPKRELSGVWDYISPSRLATWLKCPLLFKLRYYDDIRTETSPALFTGKVVHRGLEEHYRHVRLGTPLEAAEVTSRMLGAWDDQVAEEGVRFASAADEEATRDVTMRLVAKYLQQTREEQFPPIAVEKRMTAPLIDPESGERLGISMLGIVDLVLEEDGAQLIDFKTSRTSSPPHEILHEIQLTAYSYLYRQTFGRKERGLQIRSLIKTKAPQIKIHRFEARSDAHHRRLFAVIREYLDALDRGVFNYRPGWGCSMCDARETHCRNWSG